MLAQGTDLVASVKGSKIYLYTLSSGMSLVTCIKGKLQITAVSCSLNDSFVLIGTMNGQIYYYNTSDRKETAVLEECEEVTKMSLKITSIFIMDDIVYTTSENGIIRILSIETVQSQGNQSVQNNSTAAESIEKEGWLEEMESLGGDTTETASMHNISRMAGGVHTFKPLREIKHNTPINNVVVFGVNIYILDMRGRVIVFPSKVVYDNISCMHFRKYLFCVDGNTVFAEVGQVFTSIYFAESKIKEIASTKEGGYFFILTETSLEIMKINEMGGKRVFSQKLAKEISNIVVDSKRSLIYSIVNSKPSRIDLEYVWIDRKMESLRIEGSTIKEVRREEENDDQGDEYFDIPSVKAVKDQALPSIRYSNTKINAFMKTGVLDDDGSNEKKREKEDSEIEDLFNSDEKEISDHSDDREPCAETIQKPSENKSRKHCIVNGMCGPVLISNGTDKMLYWSSECTISLSDRIDYSQIEVTVRSTAVEVSILKEIKQVLLSAASQHLLLVYTENLLKVYKSSTGAFTEGALVKKIEPKAKIERMTCGTDFFCIVSECGLHSNVSIYSRDLLEIFSLVGVVKGIASSGAYTGVITEEGEGVSARLFKYEDASVRCVTSAYFNRLSIDFCGISNNGIFVFENSGALYALGLGRIIALSGSIPGVPISVVANNIAYFKESEDGSISLFPETVFYAPIQRECVLNQKLDIYADLEKEISSCERIRYETGGGSARDYSRITSARAEEEENNIYISKRHKPSASVEQGSLESSLVQQETSKSRIEHSPMHTPTKKIRQTNPFARTG
ncbi:hypothetical protein NEMIN01_1463 [Nematocida minor]|uniref:uncharacterized protein n=1 Tax=Nematocida minor TaxID=1912983 RepID=UPI00221F3DC3|nr:uncharacterized protein NEMIN01_1463 [Nematocida minor]KAI5191304.1 hypothetical protein NEMIN01_1463 [Nematocida minor]